MTMIFRTKDFWGKVPRGSEVIVKRSDIRNPEKFYFDELREFDDYGLYMLYACMQKDMKDIGNRSITVPVLVDDIEDVTSIDGKLLKEYRKIMKIVQRKNEKAALKNVQASSPLPSSESTPEPLPVPSINPPEKNTGKPAKQSVRRKKEYGFEIMEKDGRFICPCGNSFGRRDTAIYVHRVRHNKQ